MTKWERIIADHVKRGRVQDLPATEETMRRLPLAIRRFYLGRMVTEEAARAMLARSREAYARRAPHMQRPAGQGRRGPDAIRPEQALVGRRAIA